MNSRETERALAHIHKYVGRHHTQPTLDQLRRSYDAVGDDLAVQAQTEFTRCMHAGLPAEWVDAVGARQDAAVLFFHGGGYMVGSAKGYRSLTSAISSAAGARCLGVDYRLAPEAPFPAAVQDAVGAYRSLIDAGYKPNRIALAGDSAGGGLVVATMLAARAEGLPMPAAGYAMSPWFDLEGSSESVTQNAASDPVMTSAGAKGCAQVYLRGADVRDPLASPVNADLRGLPSLLLQVSSTEILLDDSIRLARNAALIGVHVDLQVWPDMFHVWQRFVPVLRAAAQAVEQGGAFIGCHFAPQS